MQDAAGDERDCSECAHPALLPENEIPYTLFQLVRSQWIIAGMGEPIALNITAVLGVLDLYEVANKQDAFEKIMYLSELDLDKFRKKSPKT